MKQGIQIHASVGEVHISVTAFGTPYSPDVADDLTNRTILLLQEGQSVEAGVDPDFDEVQLMFEGMEEL